MHTRYHRVLSLAAVLVFLALWSWAAMVIGNKVILPTVGEVADLLSRPTEDLLSMGSLLTNIVVSLLRVLLGYMVAVIIAIPLGIAMGYYSAVHTMFGDFLNLFRPIPPLAWVPLVMAWFGIASLADLFGVDRGVWRSSCPRIHHAFQQPSPAGGQDPVGELAFAGNLSLRSGSSNRLPLHASFLWLVSSVVPG